VKKENSEGLICD